MKPTIHFLPLEPLPARYTEQMLRWVKRELDTLESEARIQSYEIYAPEFASNRRAITTGQFLDTYESLIYKQQQLAMLLTAMQKGEVKDGDIILVGDVWYPGLEGVRMVADLTGLSNLVIAGWHYAGVYDPHDYYSKRLGPWSRGFESMVVSGVVDWVCTGSQFHKDFLCRNILAREERILPLGLVWDAKDVRTSTLHPLNKQLIVVFSHRLADEKAPEHFIKAAEILKREFPRWEFVFSLTREAPEYVRALNKECGSPCKFLVHEDKDGLTAKQHYHGLLAVSSIVYSSGYQETFGYSVHEGMALGCAVCLPYRACYPESVDFDTRFLYDGALDPWGVDKLRELMSLDTLPDLLPVTSRFNSSCRKFLTTILHR